MASSGKKTDMSKQGLSGVVNETIRNNLSGISKKMEKKGWVDSSGRSGKVLSHAASE